MNADAPVRDASAVATPISLALALVLGLLALSGCAPVLDWRAVALPETQLVAELPCRPGRFQRDITVAGTPLRMFMLSCEAGGVTYGLATADVTDPARVDAVLHGLAEAAASAIRSAPWQPRALNMNGATPFSGNVSARLSGRRPDGVLVEEAIRVFGRGARVFQASVIGPHLSDEGLAPFEEGLRFDLEKAVADPN
jgi:hypothetical protein